MSSYFVIHKHHKIVFSIPVRTVLKLRQVSWICSSRASLIKMYNSWTSRIVILVILSYYVVILKTVVGLALEEAPASGVPKTHPKYLPHFLFCFDIPKKTTIPDNTKSKTDVSAQHIINYQLNLTHKFSNLKVIPNPSWFYLNSLIHFLLRLDLLGLLTCFLFFASTSFAFTYFHPLVFLLTS